MKKILVLAGRLPYPLNDGWKIRTYFLLKALSETDAEVDLLAFGQPDKDCSELKEFCREVVTVPRDNSYSPIDLCKGIFSKTPFTVLNYADKKYETEFDRMLAENNYDYIQVEDIVLAQYVMNNYKTKKVLDMHNIESDLLRRYAERENNFFKVVYAKITASKLEQYEMEAVKAFDGVLICSTKEKIELERKGVKTAIEIVPNGVDCNFYSSVSAKSKEQALVFVGSMDYHANISGIEFFAFEVLPLIRKKCPELSVYVVGKNPPEHIRKLSDDKFIVTGKVPDVRSYVEKGLLTIVPLLVGGGTRLKILESMAAGRAIISTSLGAEGIDITHKDNIIIADSAEDFANEVVKLVADSAGRDALRDRAKEFVIGKYDWPIIGRKLHKFVYSLFMQSDGESIVKGDF